MIASLDTRDLQGILHSIKGIMDAEKENLITMDSQLGDGDLGITMTRAFNAVEEELKTSTENIPAKQLIRIGAIISKAAPSTMGTLLATGFMRGGKSIRETELLTLDDLSVFFRHFVTGIMDRGKAKPGDKTIIDVLDPVALCLSAAADLGYAIPEAFSAAYELANASMDTTSGLAAKHGRAAYYRENSIGKKDGGAYVGLLMVKGFHEYLQGIDPGR
jgi:phosphoenolpyruvate---glycerone phosphotransferase subunit DhaL